MFLGDSESVLPLIVNRLKSPAIFWLDAHFWPNSTFGKGSSWCPIEKETEIISTHFLADQHIILIDDFRCFIGQNGYPTQVELLQLLGLRFPLHQVEVANDIIRVLPKHLSFASLKQ